MDFLILLFILLIIGFFANLKSGIEEKKKQVLYKQYLPSLNGKNFFCFNNRKGIDEAIEKLILPYLSPQIELIYLDGRTPISSYDPQMISTMLYKLKNYSKFPHLVKIRDGEMIDMSVNNEFYNIINQHKPFESLFNEINAFFELNEVHTDENI